MFIGGGVLVGVVVQGVRGQGVRFWTKVVRRAGPAAGEWDRVEASGDGQGGTEHPGHQLVSWVGVYGRAAGVAFVFSPTVL